MTMHNKPEFNHPDMIAALKAHGLETDTPSMLADAFRQGRLSAAPGWQPIETAPKDGRFLLWLHDEGFAVVASYRKVDGDNVLWIWEMECGAFFHEATHWMPLPDPPSEARK